MLKTSPQVGIFSKLTDVISNPSDYQKEYERFGKFALVGLLGAIIDFSFLNVMLHLLRDIWQVVFIWKPFGLTIDWTLLVANTCSVSIAIISNFTWNRLWTFPESRVRKKRKQLVQFGIVNFIGLFLNNVIVLGVDALIEPYLREPYSYNLAKAMAIGVVLFWNFGVNRLWTYRGL